MISFMFFASGCVATQDWVQTWVNEQLFPINKRVSETEAGVSKVEGQVQQMSKQLAEMDSRLNQTTAKADLALENLQRLKLDRKLVLDLKQGAFFSSNSTILTSQAKKEIDSFISDLRGEADASSLLFVVAGHTDDIGHQRSNYELARLRADNAASYLMSVKKINPGRMAVISYGETAPVADNSTEAGRAKNRRVEILVYRDAISVGSARIDSPRGN
jgi:outer membrane protein OmpA-like peptidoglycan-associated protein